MLPPLQQLGAVQLTPDAACAAQRGDVGVPYAVRYYGQRDVIPHADAERWPRTIASHPSDSPLSFCCCRPLPEAAYFTLSINYYMAALVIYHAVLCA
jgi:hypothetical protein